MLSAVRVLVENHYGGLGCCHCK